MGSIPIHPQLQIPVGLGLALLEVARLTAQTLARQGRGLRARVSRRGSCLAPGAHTPLWNEVLKRAEIHLQRRGEKAKLARLLALPRQRLQVCLKSRSGCFDAERTLLFLCWLAAKEQGRELFA